MSEDNKAHTIYIVDDESIMHSILEGLLSTEGYQFAFAGNGLEAVEKITDVNPDLILLDIMMPGLSGLEVCHRLKADPKWQNVPIILLTAMDTKEGLARGLDAGANDFLQKPFDRTELLARVRSMLRIKDQYDALEAQKLDLQTSLHLRDKVAQITTQNLMSLQQLNDVGMRLMSKMDMDSVLSLTAQAALDIIPQAGRCIMHLLSDDKQQFLPVVFSDDGSKIIYPVIGIEPTVEQAINQRQAVYISQQAVNGSNAAEFDDIETLLVIPLFDEQSTIGTLSVCSAQTDAFEESQQQIMAILANQTAVAINKSRFFERRARAKEQEKQNLRKMFAQYVSPAVVDRLVAGGEDLALGGKRQEITVLFADLRGFTSFSENLDPESLVEVLNQYFDMSVDAILGQEGTLDKFMGDAIMAFFNAPLPQPDHTVRAVRAALSMQHVIAEYHSTVTDDRCMEFGIGIHVGQAVVGNVGTVQQMNYTAIGDTVNLAKRLQENAKGGQIILSQAAYKAVQDSVTVEDLGPLLVKGRSAPVHTYQLIDLNVVVSQP